MNFRWAYTAALLQAPPFVVGVVGIVAAFLGGGLPALKLHALGMAAQGVDNGVRWGAAAGGAAAIATGLAALIAFGWLSAAKRTRGLGTAGIALCAPAGLVAVWAGAWAGPVLAGATAAEASGVLAGSWWRAWPVAAAALAMALAVGLAGRRPEASPA